MDRANDDVVFVEEVKETNDLGLRELSDLQLAVVGGGVGEVTPY